MAMRQRKGRYASHMAERKRYWDRSMGSERQVEGRVGERRWEKVGPRRSWSRPVRSGMREVRRRVRERGKNGGGGVSTAIWFRRTMVFGGGGGSGGGGAGGGGEGGEGVEWRVSRRGGVGIVGRRGVDGEAQLGRVFPLSRKLEEV